MFRGLHGGRRAPQNWVVGDSPVGQEEPATPGAKSAFGTAGHDVVHLAMTAHRGRPAHRWSVETLSGSSGAHGVGTFYRTFYRIYRNGHSRVNTACDGVRA